MVEVVAMHKTHIAIHGIDIAHLEPLHNRAHRVGSMIKIIGIEDSEDIAGGESNAAVDSLVHSGVVIGHPLEPPCKTGFKRLHNIERAVGRPTVNDNTFDMGIVLSQNRFESVSDKLPPILNGDND